MSLDADAGSGQAIRPEDPVEAARLEALHRYGILDTPPEDAFEHLVGLARDLFDVPIALVSLVDATRQWFKARIGLEVHQTPREWSFCEYAIRHGASHVFVVTDAGADLRFASNPLVTGPPHIRFYAGAPLITPDGYGLGTVSVIAPEPRPMGLSAREQRWLVWLAALAVDELELRLQTRRVEQALGDAKTAQEAEARLRSAQEAAGVVAFEFGPGGAMEASPALRELYGFPGDAPVDWAMVLGAVHPEDRDALAADRERLAEQGGQFRHEYRIVLPNGGIRWLRAQGAVLEPRIGKTGPPRRVVGVAMDITERRLAEERQALLTREVDHRAKNALAVVQAAMRLTRSTDPAEYARSVEGRVAALARAQSLLAQAGWTKADLRILIEAELAAFLGPPRGGPRVELTGPRLSVEPFAVQPLSMALHELATNATKYGALSTPRGRVEVSWWLDPDAGEVHLLWVEAGGPPVAGRPSRTGFGTRLIDGTVRQQLAGRMDCNWAPEGLRCEIVLPAGRVLAKG